MRVHVLGALAAALWIGSLAAAQRSGVFDHSRDHPAIAYSTAPDRTVITALNRQIEEGRIRLAFDPDSGYLRSVLDALQIPVESQVLVYSPTSFQARRITRENPRAIYFTDRAAVGWVRGGDLIEVAAQDPEQGTIFYSLARTSGTPRFVRNNQCLSCHLSWETLAVPGPFVLTTFPRRHAAEYANGFHADHRAPIEERWGGWYVTGRQVPPRQMGNLELFIPDQPEEGPRPVAARASLEGALDLRGYPSPYSDIVALMVLEHQTHATNLITRAGWEYRVEMGLKAGEAAEGADESGGTGLPPRTAEAVDALVDYFVFVDEAPLTTPLQGSSGFAERFVQQGPRDGRGRSLRELQLHGRLMRYPLSYMVYSPGFEGLPVPVRLGAYQRLKAVLSETNTHRKYRHLTTADRAAIAEIVRDTKADLPTGW